MIFGAIRSRSFVQARILQHLSVGSILAAPVALAYGGPGAIFWMWIATFGAMAFSFAEARLARRFTAKQAAEDGARTPLRYLARIPGRFGRVLVLAYVAFALLYFLIAGVLAPVSQGFAGAQTAFVNVAPEHAGLTGVIVVLLWLGGKRVAQQLRPWVSAAFAIYVGLLVWLVVADLEACVAALDAIVQETFAFGDGGNLGATVLATAFFGIIQAVWASEAGIGGGGFELDDAAKTPTRSVQAMWVPLVLSGALGTLTAIALLMHHPAWNVRVDEPTLRQAANGDAKGNLPWLVALERPHARRYSPSDVGQSIVLPDDTPLEAGKSYRFIMRASARGHKLGDLTPKGNGLAVGRGWDIFAQVEYLVYHSKNPRLKDHPAFDLRVPVEVLPYDDKLIPSGYIYRPLDSRYDLRKLSSVMDGPYVILNDTELFAVAVEMRKGHANAASHLALVEETHASREGRAPSLLELVRDLGYSGPFFPHQHPATPMAMVASEDLRAPLGSRLKLRLESPPRGADIASIHSTRESVEIPGWTFLEGTKSVILRHPSDPDRDLRIAVKTIKSPNGLLRLHSDDSAYPDLREVIRLIGSQYTGLYVDAPSFEFEVEVHTGLNLPDPPDTPEEQSSRLRGPLANRQSLVFVHEDHRPVGGKGHLYVPHPIEVMRIGMVGPFRTNQGVSQIVAMIEHDLGEKGLWAALGLIALIIVNTVWQSIRKGMALAQAYWGRGAGLGFLVVASLTPALAARTSLLELVTANELLITGLLVVHGIALALFLPELARRRIKTQS
jgi:hypothetical protein